MSWEFSFVVRRCAYRSDNPGCRKIAGNESPGEESSVVSEGETIILLALPGIWKEDQKYYLYGWDCKRKLVARADSEIGTSWFYSFLCNWVTAFTNRYIEMMLTRRWYTDLFHIISNKVIHTQIFMMDCQQIRFVNDLLNHQEDKGPCQSPGRHGSQGSNSSFAFGIWNLKAISISFSTMNYVSAIGESFHKHGN